MSDKMSASGQASLAQLVQQLQKKVDELESREAIRDVLGRYCRGVDRMDYDVLLSCYHPDAVDDHGFFTTRSGKEFAEKAIEGSRAGFERTYYSLGTILIKVDGDKATAESYYSSMKTFRERDEHGQPQSRLSGGRWIDRFERRNGEWRIAHRKLVLEWAATQHAPNRSIGGFKVPHDDKTMPPLGRRDKTDPSYDV